MSDENERVLLSFRIAVGADKVTGLLIDGERFEGLPKGSRVTKSRWRKKGEIEVLIELPDNNGRYQAADVMGILLGDPPDVGAGDSAG